MPDAVLDHPGLLIVGVLALVLAALWVLRRVRRILGAALLLIALAAILPGPRGAALTAAEMDGWSEGLGCLRSAAGTAGIWQGDEQASDLAACRKPPSPRPPNASE